MAITNTQVTIVGNLTKDPELKQTQAGSVANMTIAVTERRFDRQANDWVDGNTTFYRAEAWKKLGENAASSFRKGQQVIAVGHLKNREYEDNEGNKRTSLELVVEAIGSSVQYGTTSFTRGGGSAAPAAAPAAQAAPAQEQAPEAAEEPAAPKASRARAKSQTATTAAALDTIEF